MKDLVELPAVRIVIAPKRYVDNVTTYVVRNLTLTSEAHLVRRIVERRLVAHSSSSVTDTPRARASLRSISSDGSFLRPRSRWPR
jgi:hypothetical protein